MYLEKVHVFQTGGKEKALWNSTIFFLDSVCRNVEIQPVVSRMFMWSSFLGGHDDLFFYPTYF